MPVEEIVHEPDEIVQASQYEDYWSFSQTERFVLPDGKQWIAFQIMNEGQKSSYQKAINRDIKINRRSGDASIKSDIADERHALILQSVTDWNMRRGNDFVAFSRSTLQNWLNVADPRIVEALEFAIRKANPWLLGDLSVWDFDDEIKRLQEMREEAVKREEGKDFS